jgi:hypothetical protein
VSLHPDKIVSLSNIANGASVSNREPIPSSTVERRAINASRTRKLLAMPKDPGAIDALAYDMRGLHWSNHLKRLKSQGVSPSTGKPKQPQQPQIVLQLPGTVTNG